MTFSFPLEVRDRGAPDPLPSRCRDHALLSLPFVFAASLGTVLTSDRAFFTSVAVSGALLLSPVMILPLKGRREPHKKRDSLSDEYQSLAAHKCLF